MTKGLRKAWFAAILLSIFAAGSRAQATFRGIAPGKTAATPPIPLATPFAATSGLGPGFGAAGLAPLSAPSPLAAPTVLPAPLPAAAVPVAPAAVSAAPAAPAAEQPGEEAKAAADAFFDSSAPSDAALDRPQPYAVRQGPLAGLKDRYHHAKLLGENFHWFTVTHIKDLWPSYSRKRRDLVSRGEVPPVRRPRAFFATMRSFGQSGRFYVLGFAALRAPEVLADAREAYARYFTGASLGPEQARAFERFLERVRTYNAGRRAHSNLRKHIRDAMLAASVMPAAAIAPFFDSLAGTDKAVSTEEFQREGADSVVAAFRRAVFQTLAEEPPSPDRVLGVVLMGSFARGAATPTSDLDVELLAHNGRMKRAALFNERLLRRWRDLGLQERHPITVHRHPLHPSKGVIGRVHNGHYMIVAENEGLERALSGQPGDRPLFTLKRELTWRGRLGNLAHFCVVYAMTWLSRS